MLQRRREYTLMGDYFLQTVTTYSGCRIQLHPAVSGPWMGFDDLQSVHREGKWKQKGLGVKTSCTVEIFLSNIKVVFYEKV